VRASEPLRRYASQVALISSIHETSSCSLEESCYVLMEDVGIDSRVTTNGSIMEYEARRYFGFSQTKAVSLGNTLTFGFSRDEGLDLVRIGSIARGFEVHERDSHVDRLMMTLHSLMIVP